MEASIISVTIPLEPLDSGGVPKPKLEDDPNNGVGVVAAETDESKVRTDRELLIASADLFKFLLLLFLQGLPGFTKGRSGTVAGCCKRYG